MTVQEVGCTSTVQTKKKRSRVGLSLIELVVVLIIVAIVLVGFGASASTQIKRANRSDVENELSVMASNLSDAYYDLGNPSFKSKKDDGSDDPDVKKSFVQFLKILESEYLGVTFDLGDRTTHNTDHPEYGSLETTNRGYHLKIADPKDAYEQQYECWFVTEPTLDRFAMFCSGGDNTIVEQGGYASGNYSDDIVMVIYPKTGE